MRQRTLVLLFAIPVVVTTATAVGAQPMTVGVTLHYGAEVLITDSEGRKSGYDPNSPNLLMNIPGTSYYEDSITDPTDDSSNPPTSESKVLEIQTNTEQRYFVRVLPADTSEYAIEFSCGPPNQRRNHVSANDIPIEPGDQDMFLLAPSPSCLLDSFVSGAFTMQSPSRASLLTYAYPSSNSVQLASGHAFRIVVVYTQRINPSSFTATLDGKPIGHLFKPKQNNIEGINISIPPGHHMILLRVSGTSPEGAPLTTLDSFVVDVK